MKFQCEACGVLGEAAGLRPMGAGVGLVCAQCGAVTELRVGGADPASTPASTPAPTPAAALTPEAGLTPAAAPTPSGLTPEAAPLASEEGQGGAWAAAPKVVRAPVAEALGQGEGASLDPVEVLRRQGLKVEPGEGPVRCPKCGFRQRLAQPCARCGLDLRRPVPKDPPWEKIPDGKQEAAQELDRRWEALTAGDFASAQPRDAFIAFATEHQLLDRAARRFRFYAQDHAGTPAGDAAAASLAKLVERMHAAFVVGQGAERGDYEAGVKKFKTGLYLVVAVMCLVVIALAVLLFGGRAEQRPEPREKPGRVK